MLGGGMEMLKTILEAINSVVWGVPTLLFFVGCGLWFSTRFHWLQIRKLPQAFRAIYGDLKHRNSDTDDKNFSTASALLASLGAVMGPGNLIGVSSAILIGGAGAVFWMWVSAVLGMAARYIESALSVLHRVTICGKNVGGPMYVMRDLGLRRTAIVFSVAGVFVSLTMANALPSGALGSSLSEQYGIPTYLTGLALSIFTCITIVGGGRRIAKVSAVLVPAVCVFFAAASLFVMFSHPSALADALSSIFRGAFSLSAGLGGLFGSTIRYGLARGIYSNEAGMGTEPIMAAATGESDPHRQGLISMTGPFLDTIVFCSFTAIVVLMAGEIPEATAASLVPLAFAKFLPGCGGFIVDATMILLVLATLASWAFYGERCLAYVCQKRSALVYYRTAYALIPLMCAGAHLGIIFTLTDITTALMALPNLIVCVRYAGEIRQIGKPNRISTQRR